MVLTDKKIISKYKENYRWINNSYATTKFDVAQVKTSKSAALTCNMSTGSYTFGYRLCTYSKQSIKLRINQEQDLPLVCDGLINLTSKKALTEDGVSFYRAKWISHLRGAAVESKPGIIAHIRRYNRHYYYHYEGTLNKISKKVIKNNLTKKINKQIKIDQLEKLTIEVHNKKIGFQDSINAGNCASGTMNFISKYDLNKRKRYTIKELLDKASSYEKKLIKKIARVKYVAKMN